MLERTDLIYVPRWARVAAVAILVCGVALGLGIAFAAHQYERAEWISPGLSMAQTSAIGLAVALVLLWAEGGTSVRRLSARLDRFFSQDLLDALRGIRMPTLGSKNGEPIAVGFEQVSGQPRAFYTLAYAGCELLVQVDATLRHLLVMYHYPVAADADAKTLDAHFAKTISAAKDVGWQFHSEIARERFDDRTYYELFFRMTLDKPFLLSAADTFYWVTDIALMSRSALLRGIETGLLAKDRGSKTG